MQKNGLMKELVIEVKQTGKERKKMSNVVERRGLATEV